MICFLTVFAFLFWQAESPPLPAIAWLDTFWLLLQTAFALALVCGLAIFVFRYLLPRLNVVALNRSVVRVIDGASLDARKRLVVVEVAGKYLLLALSENGVQTVTELDGAEVEKAVADLAAKQAQNSAPMGKITDSFAQTLERVRQKKWM